MSLKHVSQNREHSYIIEPVYPMLFNEKTLPASHQQWLKSSLNFCYQTMPNGPTDHDRIGIMNFQSFPPPFRKRVPIRRNKSIEDATPNISVVTDHTNQVFECEALPYEEGDSLWSHTEGGDCTSCFFVRRHHTAYYSAIAHIAS